MARVVITHSSYIKGLIPWLKRLAKSEEIQTITPAVIRRVRGRSRDLTIKISTNITGGYKAIAGDGRYAQEIFIVSRLDKHVLQDLINKLKPKKS